jgi:hypothetical protein
MLEHGHMNGQLKEHVAVLTMAILFLHHTFGHIFRFFFLPCIATKYRTFQFAKQVLYTFMYSGIEFILGVIVLVPCITFD